MAYTPATDDYPVNSETAGHQSFPAVTRLASGNILVVWSSSADDHRVIAAQLFDSEGNRIGSSFDPTTPSVGQNYPDVTSLADGGFALAWTAVTTVLTPSGLASEFHTKIQFFGASGAPAGSEIILGPGHIPDIVALANGSVAVTWSGTDGPDDSDLVGAIVDPNGNVHHFPVSTTETGREGLPSVAELTNGNFVVTWHTGFNSSDGGVRAQIFDSGGDMVGGEFVALQLNGHAVVEALPSGGFVVVHNRGQFFDAAGNKVGLDFPVIASGQEPAILATPDGGFIATYTSNDEDGNGIYAQQYAADGMPIGGRFLVNQVTAGNQFLQAVTMMSNGDLFFAWTDGSGLNGDSDSNGITGRIFDMGTLGTEGDDLFIGTPSDNQFFGLGGNDTFLLQQGGDDLADGGPGSNRYYFGGAFTVADRVVGGADHDTLLLQGRYTDLDLIAASLSGVESIQLLTAGNNAYGGAMAGPATYRITTDDANVPAGGLLLDASQLAAGETVVFDGSAELDSVFYLYGGGGDDSLTGGAGGDQIDGGAGADTMAGGGGDDIYFVGNEGDLVLEAVGGGAFDAVYTRANYTLRPGQEIELLASNGLAPGQGIALQGNELAQTIVGGAGNDILAGGGGNDFLTGNDGIDQLDGGAGIDVMAGGAGNDIYFVDNAGDIIQEFAGGGADTIYASAGFALSSSAEVETLAANGLAPGQGILLAGNDFAQSITGGSGNDTLLGGGGNDLIDGGAGNDLIDDGVGNDGLRGGAGADVFRFAAASDSNGAGDSIYDFVSGTDRIDLAAVDANTGIAGDQAFTFIGSGAFTNVAGQLRTELSDGVHHIFADVNGDGAADLHILAYQAPTINAGDFIL